MSSPFQRYALTSSRDYTDKRLELAAGQGIDATARYFSPITHLRAGQAMDSIGLHKTVSCDRTVQSSNMQLQQNQVGLYDNGYMRPSRLSMQPSSPSPMMNSYRSSLPPSVSLGAQPIPVPSFGASALSNYITPGSRPVTPVMPSRPFAPVMFNPVSQRQQNSMNGYGSMPASGVSPALHIPQTPPLLQCCNHSPHLTSPALAVTGQQPSMTESPCPVSNVCHVESEVGREVERQYKALGTIMEYVKTFRSCGDEMIKEHEIEKAKLSELLHKSQVGLQALVKSCPGCSNADGAKEVGLSVDCLSTSLHGVYPFYWSPCAEYFQEFCVSGAHNEIVTKTGNYKNEGWLIPCCGSLRMSIGGVYKWSLKIVSRNTEISDQMQFGIHSHNHSKPWRVITTTKCSLSRDDERWIDRPKGPRPILDSDVIHCKLDLTGLGGSQGIFSYALNNDDYEISFDDIPLNPNTVLIPIVSMGTGGNAMTLVKS